MGQQLLEIDCLLVKKHTGDSGCVFFTICLMDGLVNVVTNKVASVITLERVKLSDINLRKLHEVILWLLLLHLHLLWWHHHLLSRWLLLWWHLLLLLLLLLVVHTHRHLLLLLLLLLLMLLVVASSHLTVVVPLIVLPVVMLVIMLVTIAIWIVSFLKVSATTSLTTTSSVLESLATAHVLVSIILIVALSVSHVWTTMHRWTSLVLRSILFFDRVDKFRYVIDVFISNCILSFIFGLPEVNSQWLDLIIEETHGFIEVLDSLLRFFNAIVKYVADLVLCRFNTKLVNFVVFKLYRNNFKCIWSGFTEHFFNFFFWNTERNILNIQV